MGKKKYPVCKECGMQKEVIFKGDGIKYPVFSCPEHGSNEKNEWKVWWEKYSERWKDKEYWDNPADKPSCVMGYFCSKYKEFYGYPYSLQISNPIPYKSKDFTMVRRILAMFNNDAHEVRTYIRWVFAKKVRHRRYPITSVGFFATGNFINEYKHAKARSKVLRRSTVLPKEFLDWCVLNYPIVFQKQELSTWNDLNGLLSHVKNYGYDNAEGNVVIEAIKRKMLPVNDGEPDYIILED